MGKAYQEFISASSNIKNQTNRTLKYQNNETTALPEQVKQVKQEFAQLYNEQQETLATLQTLLEEIRSQLDRPNQQSSVMRARTQTIVDDAGLYDTF